MLHSAVDEPAAGSRVARYGFVVSGFVSGETIALSRVSVMIGDQVIGSTALRYQRPDVAAALGDPAARSSGFRIDCRVPAGVGGSATVVTRAEFADGSVVQIDQRRLHLSARDYADAPYGGLAAPDGAAQIRREHIYGVGPPSALASPECSALLLDYLPAGSRVLDVGCGVGAYAEPLEAGGMRWRGCEVIPEFVEAIAARGFTADLLTTPLPLPYEDASFDAVICIEVLEHIDDPLPFLREIARVTAGPAYFSVPNSEAIPLLSGRLAVPWHLLEAEHVNFFNRPGLRALLAQAFASSEIVPYGEMPLRTDDDTAVPYHLFAIAAV